ncbi:synaptotagmin-15 [Alosa sapidissima]|uniref:synaptotagmin-15 n=1 Tax=Alosa sapidissima TaxID=34773 RepID=UPI001C0819D9|nr:synaptotagmin-15 [Alosa sapidissima]
MPLMGYCGEFGSYDVVAAVAGGVSTGLLLLLLLAVSAYLLWVRRRRRRSQRQSWHPEIVSTPPAVPSCTSPLALSMQTSRRGHSSRAIPFFLPPRFKSWPHASLQEEDEEQEEEQGPTQHHAPWSSWTAGRSVPLGNLRPDLYHVPEEPSEWAPPTGGTVRLWFAVEYQQEREQLVVSLLRAANLPARCHGNATLVRLQLLPDDRRHRQAKAKRKGRDPKFNDSFIFQVSRGCVDECTLSLSVLSVDRLKKHQLVGRVLLPLRWAELREAAGKIMWRDLETENGQPYSKHGDVQVSLNYNAQLQRLTVVVLRARGLPLQAEAGVCVQVSLQLHMQVVRTKKTALARGSEPTFNEKLTFKLLPPQMDEASLSLQVQRASAIGPVSLGVVVIGPIMYARGRELEHWNDMVSKPQELVKQWHGLGTGKTIQNSS